MNLNNSILGEFVISSPLSRALEMLDGEMTEC